MTEHMIFVFGSNLAGRHGRGAALVAARQHGAIYGQGEGRMGNAYALPTKNHRIQTMPVNQIEEHVRRFLTYAEAHPDEEFQVTQIGTGLAGLPKHVMARMFLSGPPNLLFDLAWKPWLDPDARYWGTYHD